LAKQVKRPVKKKVAPPVEQPPVIAGPLEKNFPYIITGVFFILSLIGILNHEMWRDEYQAWMVAADAHSLPQLFQNLKYEGNPALWHLFLYLISSFTDNPFGMQLFHILISASFIFLFNKYAPFPLLLKILFSFGYYAFFEYNLISRSYGLGLLLVIAFCILYPNRQKYLFFIAAILFLLANDTIFGVILSLCFSGMIFLEYVFHDRKSKISRIPFSSLAVFLLIVFAGVVIGYLQIRPEPDNSFPTLYVTNYDPIRLKWALSRLVYAYFSFPDFSTIHFWNTNFFVSEERQFPIAIALIPILLWMIAFMRYRLVFVVYMLGTLVLLSFYYYTGLIWSRYAGHLFLLLMACCWLVYYQKEKPYTNTLLNKLSLLGNKIRMPFFILILAIHFCGGVTSYIMDLIYPFSTSARAAAYLRENNLTQYEIIGSRDFVVSPLVSQLGKKILYAERREYGSFIIYDQKRTNIWSLDEVVSFVSDMNRKEHKRIILVKDFPILKTYDDTGESVPWDEGMMTDSLSLTLLTSIKPGIVNDEQYFIYSVDEVNPQ
jgi:hypothetical protein